MNYPALMAADIILYNTDVVPIGDDQKQHMELCKNIINRFNKLYGNCLKAPRSLVVSVGSRIMGLDNPLNKMSKSYIYKKNHLISLLDTENQIKTKVMAAITDSNDSKKIKHASIGIKNLCIILKCLSGLSFYTIEKEFLNKGYIYLKKQVIDIIIETLRPIKKNYYHIINDLNYVKQILTISKKKVNNIAKKQINIIKQKMDIYL